MGNKTAFEDPATSYPAIGSSLQRDCHVQIYGDNLSLGSSWAALTGATKSGSIRNVSSLLSPL